jgi:HAE1 family hydrophobic/amphiphilic exporter-1
MIERFIHRPVTAIVLAILTVFLGVLAMRARPVSQFPEISPPRVMVSLAFPGASADVLVQSSIITLERAINGVPGMSYMLSDATSAGEAVIQVVFELGTDPNEAMVNVKSRVDQMMSRLPQLVQLEGVIVNIVQPSMLMYVNLYSTEKTADQKFLYNFASVNLLPELSRVNGIAQARILGSRQYAMRVWLNPDRMRAYNVSVDEVMEAMADQSVIGRPGRLGQATGIAAQALEYVLVYQGRYNKPEQYENIIIRASPDGEMLRLKDIARVELGSEFFDIYSNLDGYPSAAIVLKQTYGSNARQVIAEVKARLEELKKKSFPPGMDYQITYDVSTFLDASIEKVLHTLVEAFVLVALVVFVFLGDWRSTLIPTLAVPVSLIGAFVAMQAFGVSINLITLFALVMAIGVVVDNAIVVVEAVHVKMHEEHLTPFAASKKTLEQIAGAVIAITLMMASVFVPISFMTGPVGVFYRQFAVTMASSIILSGVIALTFTPVLCAMLLRSPHGQQKRRTPFRIFLDAFNRRFEKETNRYVSLLKRIVHRRSVTVLMTVLFGAGIVAVNEVLPAGFVPSEDQGMIYAILQTPPGTTLERTNDVARQLQEIARKVEGVESVASLAGYEVLTEGRGSNAGTCLINLKPWSERTRSVQEIIEELEEKSKNLGAIVEFFQPPAVPGYGAADGFALRLLDQTNETDYQEFDRVQKEFMENLRKRKELTGLFSFFAADYPQYELVVDTALAKQKGVSIKKAMENLDILIGSTYEQGFIRFGNFFKVYVQASPEFRRYTTDLLNYFVKNDKGDMVPYSAFMTLKKTQGPNEITRYNMYNSAAIRGGPARGYTSGDAIAAVKEVAKKTLPRGYDIAWEGLSFDEARRGNEALAIFFIVIGFVYLVLAAQYESFLLPLAVLLSLPAGVFGSLLLLRGMGLANDIYAQLGLVMLVGMLGKNAVLIVEFANQMHRKGAKVLDAAIEGARVRFRPILMTSFAFIAGLIPLVRATGPGAIGNRTIGASALGGMFFGTVFGVMVVPGLYYIFGTLSEGKALIRDEDDESLTEKVSHHV